jgi:hypothetical protein
VVQLDFYQKLVSLFLWFVAMEMLLLKFSRKASVSTKIQCMEQYRFCGIITLVIRYIWLWYQIPTSLHLITSVIMPQKRYSSTHDFLVLNTMTLVL